MVPSTDPTVASTVFKKTVLGVSGNKIRSNKDCFHQKNNCVLSDKSLPLLLGMINIAGGPVVVLNGAEIMSI